MTESVPVVRPAKLSHLVLRSGHFAETVRWWKTVIGMEAVHETASLAFLTFDDEHHRLAVVALDADAEPVGGGRPGLAHVAFTYRDLDELVGTYERLVAVGIEPTFCVNHGMTLSMYYADPDGHQAELQIDLCTPEEAASFMATTTFADNPVGIEFDPAELAAAHRAGDATAILRLYGPAADTPS